MKGTGLTTWMLEDLIQTVEQVSIVDQVSRGPFKYGAGGRTRGSDVRREQFFEYLEVMKQLWSEGALLLDLKVSTTTTPHSTSHTCPSRSPYQKPYPPMLLPVDSQESFVPMGAQGYRIAIGAGSFPPQPQGVGSPEGRRKILPEGLEGRGTPRRPDHRGPHTHPGGCHQGGGYPPDWKT